MRLHNEYLVRAKDCSVTGIRLEGIFVNVTSILAYLVSKSSALERQQRIPVPAGKLSEVDQPRSTRQPKTDTSSALRIAVLLG